MPLCLYLIRHGETQWSLSGRHTGRTDIALTAQGEAQARQLAQRLHGILFACVLSSPLQRAQQTCHLAGLGSPATTDPGLAEWDYGEYEGQHSLDIRAKRPGWSLFTDGCPGGEAPEHISERADQLITRLRPLDGNVALFSHGHFGAALAARWIGLPVARAQHFPLGTASISILGYKPDRPDLAIIVLWNAVVPAATASAVQEK